MSSSESSKRQRQGKPKVKTGCATCKSRKVKCDETRPYCLRCIKFGRKCEGYEPGQLRPTDVPLLAIQPRPVDSLSIYRPSTSLSDDPDEQRYFHDYCEQIASDISGPFQSEFWYRIVPQAAQNEPAIKHATIAISALMRTLSRMVESTVAVESPSIPDAHHKFALLQYTTAVKNLRTRMREDAMPHRTLLIACLLFICIDSLQGDVPTALQQINGGLSVLCASRPWSNSIKPSARKPWNPEPIEDELWQMLTNLNVHAYMLTNTQHPHRGPQYSEKEMEKIYPPIPLRFHSLTQAKLSLDLVLSGIPMFHERGEDDPLADKGIASEYNRRKEYEAHSKRLDSWEAAYDPFLKSINVGQGGDHFGEYVLPIYHKTVKIILEAGRSPDETNYDKFLDEFEYIVSNSRKATEYRLSHLVDYLPRFSFDVGLLPSLHLTAAKCRDPEIRREAIKLLYMYPQQEGIWSGFTSAKICEWMMGLEEAEMDGDGFIPETARVKLVELDCDLKERKVWVKCENVSATSDGSRRTREWEYYVR